MPLRVAASLGIQITPLVACFLFGIAAPAIADLPKFPPPPEAQVVKVSSQLDWNGIEMSVRRFTSKNSEEEVLGFYRKEWARGGLQNLGYRETYSVDWRIISRIEDRKLMTVQTRPAEMGEGTVGLLAMSALPQLVERGFPKPPATEKAFPTMKGSKTLGRVSSRDPGKAATTLQISNDFSVAGNIRFYRNFYEGSGWDARGDQRLGDSHALTFVRSGRQVTLVVSSLAGQTTIVAQIVESN